MRILVVGAGMYVTGRGTSDAGTILPALAQLSRRLPLESVTVVATKPDNAPLVAAAARQLNARLGTSLAVEYRALRGDLGATIADLALDAAIVSVPDDLHGACAQALLARDVHCLVVKPLTPTVAEARALLRLQRAHRLHAVVDFHKRYDASNRYAREVLARGLLGAPLYVTVEFSQRQQIPLHTFRAWVERTNVFQYLGVHYVDLVHYLTGFLPVRALAVGRRGYLRDSGVDTWDAVHAIVEWRDPARANAPLIQQLALGWVDPAGSSAMSDQRCVLVGSQGRLLLDQKHRGLELATATGAQAVNPWFSEFVPDADGAPSFAGYGFDSIERFVLDVADVRAGRVAPADLESRRPSFRQALVSTAVVEAVNASLAADSSWRPIDDPLGE
jgi:predicted dehydrogenase